MEKDREIEAFARELQEQILERIRKEYSDVAIDHWQNPRNFKTIKNPDAYAKVTGPCGDTMEMFITVQNEKIFECGFQTDGCGSSIVCGSVATELVKKKTLDQALDIISADKILKILGGLPEAYVHCAQLSAETMRRALTDCLSQKKSSWKKNVKDRHEDSFVA
jgi:nitrogen fixation NifU-like protein